MNGGREREETWWWCQLGWVSGERRWARRRGGIRLGGAGLGKLARARVITRWVN